MDCGLSVTLLLNRRKVVVVGAGPAVDREVARLLVAGARVFLIDPHADDQWRDEPGVQVQRREAVIGDLQDAVVVFACCEAPQKQAQIASWGELLGIPVALAAPSKAEAVAPSQENLTDRVALVGAGPGDPELLTLKARRLLAEAEVVIYDRLISPDLLAFVSDTATLFNVGKSRGQARMSQVQITSLLVAQARTGKRVVRLKGGDPMLFGRAAEELEALRAAHIEVTVVPGITAALGCAAEAGICLTDRDRAHGVHFVSATRAEPGAEPPWRGLLHPQQTLVFYMGMWRLEALCRDLIAEGAPPTLPVALISQGTSPRAQVIRADLSSLPEAASTVVSPALLIVGEVARSEETAVPVRRCLNQPRTRLHPFMEPTPCLVG